jgi:cytochrome P450
MVVYQNISPTKKVLSYLTCEKPYIPRKLLRSADLVTISSFLSQAIIKEAMRIHPGVGYPLERYVPSGGLDIMGIHLPAGTEVSMTAPVIHQNKEIFGVDADRFRPERWIDSTPEQIKQMDRCNMTVSHN